MPFYNTRDRYSVSAESVISVEHSTTQVHDRTVQELADLTGETVADVITSIHNGALDEWLRLYGNPRLVDSSPRSKTERWTGDVVLTP